MNRHELIRFLVLIYIAVVMFFTGWNMGLTESTKQYAQDLGTLSNRVEMIKKACGLDET